MISNTDHYIYIGGLVGFNTGRITHSYATGSSTSNSISK